MRDVRRIQVANGDVGDGGMEEQLVLWDGDVA